MGVGGQRHAPAACTSGKYLVPIVQEAGWAPGSVWTDAENLTSTGIRSPDLPARSESLYRLSSGVKQRRTLPVLTSLFPAHVPCLDAGSKGDIPSTASPAQNPYGGPR
jgi:hypothetical protein